MIEPKLGFETFMLICLPFCRGHRFRVLEGNTDWQICLRNSAFASNSRSSGQSYREIERHKNLQLSGISRKCTAFRKIQSKTRAFVLVAFQCKPSNSCKQGNKVCRPRVLALDA